MHSPATDSLTTKSVSSGKRVFQLAILLIYFLSGVTALSYEILWAKMLTNLFGVSIFGIAITVSSFLLGLGIGSIIGHRYNFEKLPPIIIFSLIELVVAIFAFNLPGIFSNLENYIFNFGDSLVTWFSIQLFAVLCIMLFPALLLGIGFPLMISVGRKIDLNVGLIYGLNTLGGAIGSILVILLLPIFAWTVSLRLVAILAIIVAVIAIFTHYVFARKLKFSSISKSKPRFSKIFKDKNMVAYFFIGVSVLMLEIIWTRIYGVIMLRTEYVLAIILFSLLCGIGFGSVIGNFIRHKKILNILPPLTVFFVALTVWTYPYLSQLIQSIETSGFIANALFQMSMVFFITLPAMLCFGMWMPILAEKLGVESAPELYAVNSIGAALGGLVAAFVLLPLLGSFGAICFAVLLLIVASYVWTSKRIFAVCCLLFLGLLPFSMFPKVSQLMPSQFSGTEELLTKEDAINLTHVLEDKNGERVLLADLQRMDASTNPEAVVVQKNQSRLPIILKPDAKEILLLGLGTGITASGLPVGGERNITAVEISPGAIQAAEKFFSKANNNITKDISIVIDDARRYLVQTNKQYDLVVGELFHPDLVGRSALLSQQQFKRVKNVLNSDGVFAQWITLNQFDIFSFQVILQTFKTVFPNSHLYVDGFRCAMIGYMAKPLDYSELKKKSSGLFVDPQEKESLETWLGRYWGEITDQDVAIQDEWSPIIEYRLPRIRYEGKLDLIDLLEFLFNQRIEEQGFIARFESSHDDKKHLNTFYDANNLYYASVLANFNNDVNAPVLLQQAYKKNPNDRWISFAIADGLFASMKEARRTQGLSELEALERVLSVRSDHIPALKRKYELSILASNMAEANRIKQYIIELSPYDKMNRQ